MPQQSGVPDRNFRKVRKGRRKRRAEHREQQRGLCRDLHAEKKPLKSLVLAQGWAPQQKEHLTRVQSVETFILNVTVTVFYSSEAVRAGVLTHHQRGQVSVTTGAFT